MGEAFPLVTVITASYRKFDKLFDTIDSVLAQDYPNIEYIIADDSSDNFDYDSVLSYINNNSGINIKNIQIIHNEENLGTVRNLNNALRKSNGVYILPLSCNDVFYDDNVVTDIVKEFLRFKCEVIVTSRMLYKNDFEPVGCVPRRDEVKKLNKASRRKLHWYAVSGRWHDFASGSAMYYSKEYIKSINYYDERFRLWEDGPFIEKTLRELTIHRMYDRVSIWYQDGGVSSANTNPFLIEDYNIYTNVLDEADLTFYEKRYLKFYRLGKSGYFEKRKLSKLKYIDIIISGKKYLKSRLSND